jgi:hypothetical protein
MITVMGWDYGDSKRDFSDSLRRALITEISLKSP